VVKVLGLTGGIASGKSTVAAMLRARGAALVDADQVARDVVAPGQPGFGELVARFGMTIVDADGTLDRKALGAIVFADPHARRDLNAITHPRIAAASQAAIARLAAAGAPVVFYEAALLIENQLHRTMDGVIVVAALPEVQAQRLGARDALDAEAVSARLEAQLPLAAKLAVATWVIDNAGDRAALATAVETLWLSLEGRFGQLTAPPPEVEAVEEILITGLPAATPMRLLEHILARDLTAHVHLVVPAEFAAHTEARLGGLGRARVRLLVGNVAAMDLGLSTDEYRALAAVVTTIHHVAPLSPIGHDARERRRHRVEGTRSVVELAADAPHLRRLIHWSSIRVSGDRDGVVLEDELECGQGFRTPDDRALFDAERTAVAARHRLPVTVLRVGHVVDERAGEHADHPVRDDSATAVLAYIATNPWPVRLPLPGGGAAPFHLVPIAFVVAAGHQLALDERAAGATFHLVDPDPLPVRTILEHVAALAGLRAPRGSLPSGLARMFLRTPGVTRFARVPAGMLALLTTSVTYSPRHARALLAGTGIACPPFADYADNVVAALKAAKAARRAQRAEAANGADSSLDETIDPLG